MKTTKMILAPALGQPAFLASARVGPKGSLGARVRMGCLIVKAADARITTSNSKNQRNGMNDNIKPQKPRSLEDERSAKALAKTLAKLEAKKIKAKKKIEQEVALDPFRLRV
jgi:hypothetical protein